MVSVVARVAARALLASESISQESQRGRFADFVAPPAARPLAAGDLTIFTAVFEPALGRVVAVFTEPGALHIVFRGEVFPLSEAIDRRYRELRKRLLGRTADIESLTVDLDRGWAQLFGSSSLLNLVYETNLHGYDWQPWTGRLYKNTWNGLLTTRRHPSIRVRGGYEENPFQLRTGNRAEAEEFAIALG
jgi:hypothetical protein